MRSKMNFKKIFFKIKMFFILEVRNDLNLKHTTTQNGYIYFSFRDNNNRLYIICLSSIEDHDDKHIIELYLPPLDQKLDLQHFEQPDIKHIEKKIYKFIETEVVKLGYDVKLYNFNNKFEITYEDRNFSFSIREEELSLKINSRQKNIENLKIQIEKMKGELNGMNVILDSLM